MLTAAYENYYKESNLVTWCKLTRDLLSSSCLKYLSILISGPRSRSTARCSSAFSTKSKTSVIGESLDFKWNWSQPLVCLDRGALDGALDDALER